MYKQRETLLKKEKTLSFESEGQKVNIFSQGLANYAPLVPEEMKDLSKQISKFDDELRPQCSYHLLINTFQLANTEICDQVKAGKYMIKIEDDLRRLMLCPCSKRMLSMKDMEFIKDNALQGCCKGSRVFTSKSEICKICTDKTLAEKEAEMEYRKGKRCDLLWEQELSTRLQSGMSS